MSATQPVIKGVIPGGGQYAVGCTDFMSRSSDIQLGCFFRLFYPTDKSNEDKTKFTSWLPSPDYARGYGDTMSFPGFSFVTKIFAGSKKVPAMWNAPLISSGGKLPVIVFSHGLSACRTTYSTICLDLASHGFVVAAVEHRDESACISFFLKESETGDSEEPKLEWLRLNKGKTDDFELRNKQVRHRADECIGTLNILIEIHSGTEVTNLMPDKYDFSQLKGRLDLDRIAVCGHSFGGGTSILSLARDSRFKCSVALDAWLFPLSEDVYDKVTQPILFINTETFQWKDNMKRLFKLMPTTEQTDSRRMFTIKGTAHINQCDIPMLLGLTISKILKFRGPLRPDIAFEVNNRAMIAFLWKHLNIDHEPQWDHYYLQESEHVLLGTNVNMEPTKPAAKH